MTNETLSSKRKELHEEMELGCTTLDEEHLLIAVFDFIANQDKDFIQKLKEEMMKMANHNPDSHPDKSCFHCAIWKKIDKLSGRELIK